MALHDKLSIGPYTLENVGFTQDSTPTINSEYAQLDVSKGGKTLFQMTPEKRVTWSADSRRPWWRCIRFSGGTCTWCMRERIPDTGQPIIKAFLNPLVSWIWAGVVLILLGTLWRSLPARSRQRKKEASNERCQELLDKSIAGGRAGRGRLLLGRGDRRGSRYTGLNHRLMCTCGCAEILGECNHVGCQNSTGELNELREALPGARATRRSGLVRGKYGAVVLAAPTTQGFDWWPGLRRLRCSARRCWARFCCSSLDGGQKADEAVVSDPATEALREKIRRETDSGNDGGF